MKIVPLRNRVVIRRDLGVATTPGGLILPDEVREQKQFTGIVISVGPGIQNRDGTFTPTEVKEGQRVVFPKYTGTALDELDKNVFIVAETEVLAVVGDEVEIG